MDLGCGTWQSKSIIKLEPLHVYSMGRLVVSRCMYVCMYVRMYV